MHPPVDALPPAQRAPSVLVQRILHLARSYRRLVDRQLAEHRLSEARALPVLQITRAGAEMRQRELAEQLGIEGPSLVRLLDSLEAAALVERRPDPHDGRAKTLHATPAGRALAATVEDVLHTVRERVFAQISPEDLAITLRTIEAIETSVQRALDGH